MVVNGVTIYLSMKTSGRNFWGYLHMISRVRCRSLETEGQEICAVTILLRLSLLHSALPLASLLQFEGSAQLPPEWDEKTTSRHGIIDGNYHVLKLAQQMKILQVLLRGATTLLRREQLCHTHMSSI